MYSHVLVGTDGSDTATRAVEAAARLARAHDARLTIVHAFRSGKRRIDRDCPPEFNWWFTAGAMADEVVHAAAQSARTAADGALDVDVRHHTGAPVAVLLDVIDELKPDAVVVGNADVRRVRVRRSIGHALTRKTSVDVLVVDTRAA